MYLDLIARRYPNRRPSDLVDGLDSWQAMEMDVALALKYSTLEKEETLSHVDGILSAIDNVVKTNGGTVGKRKRRPSLIKPYTRYGEEKTEHLPLVSDVIRQLTGGSTVLDFKIDKKVEKKDDNNGR